ncbi:MAG: hypothetical protein GEV09_08340 [Pseudonocardiaceae bacterium]|nr:hypothetical protein [Pseudonocardiaceae bacterium]
MALVTVIGVRHRDGWLQVDTTDWLADRAQPNDDLIAWLETDHDDHSLSWIRNGYGVLYPTTLALHAWMRERFGYEPVGIYGEDGIYSTLTTNYDSLLSDDIGYVFARCGPEKLLIVTANEFWFCSPRVYDYTASDDAYALDTGTALGACDADHHCEIESGAYLIADTGSSGAYRVADRVRVPFGDSRRAYIACITCGRALRFMTITD